jgi:hypothetical protein
MNVFKLLRFLLLHVLHLGIVEAGAGGAADDDTQTGAGDDTAGGADDGGGEDTAGGAEGEDTVEGAGAESEGGETDAANDAGAAADELVVTIGDDTAPAAESEEEARAPEWVRQLRKSDREKTRRLRELEAENARLKGAQSAPAPVVVGEKPTLAACDFDQDKFEAELTAWHERKRRADEQAAEKKKAEDAAAAAWAAKVEGYKKAASTLNVKDFEDAEATTIETLNTVQQGIILQGAKRPELVVYALGKNPKKAKELGEISDPVKFAFAVANLERDLKVTTRKQAPAPERTVRSTVAGAAVVDNELAKLRAEAERTGDYSKVYAHRQRLREREAERKRA